jgi:hypothetical protein
MEHLGRSTNLIKAAFVLAALTVFAASCLKQGEKSPVPLTASETPEPPVVKASTSNFASFNHKIAEHKRFDCVSCHRRDAKDKTLEYAGHDSCIGCHLNQFIANKATDENRAMCSICHANLNSDQPPMKVFPAKFIEGFNMKFDHAAHERGKARHVIRHRDRGKRYNRGSIRTPRATPVTRRRARSGRVPSVTLWLRTTGRCNRIMLSRPSSGTAITPPSNVLAARTAIT